MNVSLFVIHLHQITNHFIDTSLMGSRCSFFKSFQSRITTSNFSWFWNINCSSVTWSLISSVTYTHYFATLSWFVWFIFITANDLNVNISYRYQMLSTVQFKSFHIFFTFSFFSLNSFLLLSLLAMYRLCTLCILCSTVISPILMFKQWMSAWFNVACQYLLWILILWNNNLSNWRKMFWKITSTTIIMES